MSPELISLSIIVGWAISMVVAERLRPYEPGQKVLRRGFFTDFVMYSLFHSWWMGVSIAALIQWIDHGTGVSRLQLVTAWPPWIQFLFFVVTHDLYIYWFHRWQHSNPILWRSHEAHHSVRDVDWVAGSRSHALEILINQTVEFAPIVLLGAAPEVAIWKATLDAVWGMWIHSNVNVRSGRLQWLINGPEMHRWHHVLGNPTFNFATKLACWDFVFGTAHNPRHARPSAYGLAPTSDYPEEPLFESGTLWHERLGRMLPVYFAQHAWAFRRFAREERT